MTETEKRVPELRFKGFADAWEQRMFSNIVNRVSQQSNDSNLPKVEFEDIISGEGRLNKDISSKFDSRKGTVFEPEFILYGKLRPYLKNWLFPNFKGIALGDFWVFEPNNSSSIFDYYLIQSDKYQTVANLSSGTKMPRSDWKTVSETEFSIPVNIEEQAKIGTFFKQLDDTIALHQRKLALLKQLKQTYLDALFPQNDENIPTLRFAGFSDFWEQRKLKDLFERNTEKNNGQFDFEKTISIATMKFKTEGNGAAEESLNSYKVLRMGDIAFEGHKSKLFSFGRFVLNDIGDGIMSPRFTTLRPKKNMYIPFWKQYIIYEPIMKHVLVKSTKLGTMMNELVLEDFFQQQIFIPSENEQQKIGSFFNQLDDTIALHQQKVYYLKSLKSTLINKMFI